MDRISNIEFETWIEFRIWNHPATGGAKKGEKIIFQEPKPGPDGSIASGWYERLRGPISVFNSG